MVIFWLCVLVVMLVIEAATAGLATIWFAGGALIALLTAVAGGWLWLQIVLFLVVSIGVLLTVRPLARKYLTPARKPTNADRVIGMACVVKEDIDNVEGKGQVEVDGKVWTARSAYGERFKAGELVRAVAIEGVKLIVAPVHVEEKEETTV